MKKAPLLVVPSLLLFLAAADSGILFQDNFNGAL